MRWILLALAVLSLSVLNGAAVIEVTDNVGSVIYASEPQPQEFRLETPFTVLNFDETYLATLEFVPRYPEPRNLNRIQIAIERLIESVILALSLFLGFGLMKLHIPRVYGAHRRRLDEFGD